LAIFSDITMKRYRAIIWFVEKWREYPRIKYYEAETKKEVTAKVREDFPNYRELLIVRMRAEALAESPKASILEIGEIKGVGKALARKLRRAGFDTVESIASVDAETVSEKTGISSKVTVKLIASAKELLE